MKDRKIPMRKCVGCMTSKEKKELVRIAGFEGQLSVDLTGRAKGRGAYLCRNADCLEKAFRKKALGRAFRGEVGREEYEALRRQLTEQEAPQ